MALKSDNCRFMGLTSKKKFTIIEGMKVFEITTSQQNSEKYNKLAFWQKAAGSILPERTAESLFKFWKQNHSKTLEEYLIQSIFEKTAYSLSLKEIPNEQFLERFKAKYQSDFLKLELLKKDELSDGSLSEGEMRRLRQELNMPIDV